MVSISDIQRAIRETIEHRLPGIEFDDSGLAMPLKPSFRLNYIVSKDKKIASKYEKKKSSFELVYFSSETNANLDIIEKQELLENIFKEPVETEIGEGAACEVLSLDIEDANFSPNNSDGFLTCVIDIEVVQGVKDELLDNANSRFDRAINTNTEMIEELIIREE